MNKKVLWIRHCEACHNNLSLSQKLFTSRLLKEPLCKVKAVKEAEKIGKVITTDEFWTKSYIDRSNKTDSAMFKLLEIFNLNFYFNSKINFLPALWRQA